MAQGGARPRSAPNPNPYSLRSARGGKEWTRLPAAGRLKPAPEWPDEVDPPSEKELLLWRRLWTKPQALIWEIDQCEDVVAFYVRAYLEAMRPRANAQARTLTKQLQDQVYLTGSSLASGRYVIEGSDEDAELARAAAGPKPEGAPGIQVINIKDRFKIVPPADDDAPDNGEPPF